jgi:CO/xanthine dehydrogenase FAD-binding subunit
MIPFDFQYYRPDTIEEATMTFKDLDAKKLSPIYYGGGTEIITQARKQVLSTGAVIDIKNISECKMHEESDGLLIFGAALTLTEIIEKNLFPFFSKVCRPIADHTVRNKLTLGGNICGKLPYREAILPLLVVDSKVVLAGPEGIREVPITKAFDKRLLLKKGEFFVQIKVPKDVVSLPYFNRRREKHTSVDYPIINIAAVKSESKFKMAFSGVSALPFRSQEVEDFINKKELPPEERVSNAINKLPLPIKRDQWASSEYRKALLEKSMNEMIADLEGVSL